MAAVLARLRWIVLLGIAGLVLVSIVASVSGLVDLFDAARALLAHERGAQVRLVHAIDLFLVSATAFILDIGLYEIFIGPVDVPAGLRSKGFDDLKARLIVLLVLIVAIDFVENFVEWSDGPSTLEHAAAAALFIGALVVFLRWAKEPQPK
jgi:uncharacterized membrane protein YqhA